jgi:hypothetical protein
MSKETITKFRLILNGIGCFVIVSICIPVCISLAYSLRSLPPPIPSDPDSGKGLIISLFGIGLCGFLGISAAVSLIRTLKKLFELSKE